PMSRDRAADDYQAIRLRMEELRRERQGDEPLLAEKPIEEPDAVAHVPRGIVSRYLAQTRRVSSR
ncbi:MAG TPA: hypothetical protein VG328_15185, partial [Stellaceae bacterium]|nr:hypothetical protein [Stellaceae bacterium]